MRGDAANGARARGVSSRPTTAALGLRVLGPLEVIVGGESTPVTRVQVRHTLALLASAGGAFLSADQLIEEIWGQALPQDPRQSLHVTFSRARSVLGAAASALKTSTAGYALSASITDVTGVRLAMEQPERGRNGLELWRGAPLLDIPESPLIEAWRAELEDLFVQSHIAAARRALGSGRPEDAAAMARAVHDRHGTNEPAAVILVDALAATGDKRAAIGVAEALRAELRNAGLTAGPALDAAEAAVFALDAEIDPVRSQPRHRGKTVGRADELSRILDHSAPVVIVRGEPGIGKTTLAREAEQRLMDAGQSVLHITCRKRATRPMEPVLDLVTGLAAGGATLPDPAIARWLTHDDESGSSPPPFLSRSDLVRSVSDGLEAALAQRATTVFVDDAQWMDSTSALVFADLLQRRGSRLRFLARRTPGLPAPLGEAAAGALALELEGLTTGDVTDLVHDRFPSLAARSGELHHLSGGNPLLLVLIAESLVEGAGSERVGEVPAAVLLSVQERLSQLSPGAVSAVECAAVIGDDFDLVTLHHMNAALADAIGEAAEQGLITLTGLSGNFEHSLLASAIRQLVAPARLTDLHAQAAEAMLAAGRAPIEITDHALATWEINPSLAVDILADAGDSWLVAFGFSEAAHCYREAHQILQSCGAADSTPGARTLLGRGRAERLLGEPSHVQTLMDAAILAQTLGDPLLVADTAIELSGHSGTSRLGSAPSEVSRIVSASLDFDLPVAARTRLCASAATLLSFSSAASQGTELFNAALQAAIELGDAELERDVYMNIHMGLPSPEMLPQRLELIERFRAVAGEDDDARWEVGYLDFTNGAIIADHDRVCTGLEVMRSIPDELLARPRGFGRHNAEAAAAMMFGDLAEVRPHLEAALAAGSRHFSSSWAVGAYLLGRIVSAQTAGTTDDLSDMTAEAAADAVGFDASTAAVALTSLWAGDTAGSAALLADARANRFASVHRDGSWIAALWFWSDIAIAVGDQKAAALLCEELRAFEDTVAWAVLFPLGPAAMKTAELALACGDHAEANRAARVAARVAASLQSARFAEAAASLQARVERENG